MPRIEMLVDLDGNLSITKVEGIEDMSCLEATRPYENAVGISRESTRQITIELPPEEINDHIVH